MNRILAFIVCMITFSVASANNCNNAMTQLDMNTCASLAFKKSDQRLNDAYQKLKLNKDHGFQYVLKKSQLAWIKFRDDDCKVQSYPTRGGSAQPMIYANCLKEKTDLRIVDLNKMLVCQEGDITCQIN